MQVAVLGAGGYVGGRLVRRLLNEGHNVRVLTRDVAGIRAKPWGTDVEIFEVNLPDSKNLELALESVDVCYYLIHSLTSDTYVESELTNAKTFAAFAGHLKQIIYLGGMPVEEGGSTHLITKKAVASILGRAAPLLEINAGPVIGSGSASYELLRDLVSRLPVLLVGNWGGNRLSMIGIDDLLACLMNGLKFGITGEARVGIEPTPIEEIIDVAAVVEGRSVRTVRFKLLTPGVATALANLISSVEYSVINHLFESLPFESCGPNELGKALLGSPPSNLKSIFAGAAFEDHQNIAETRWTDVELTNWDYTITESSGAFRETVAQKVSIPARALYSSVLKLGGRHGWGRFSFLWRWRGTIDKLLGGPGYTRTRALSRDTRLGDTVDFWRVRDMQRDKRLVLVAEMKLPGEGFLIFDFEECDEQTKITQTALFRPYGLGGWLYWWLSFPFHKVIFVDLMRKVLENARTRTESTERRSTT